MKTAISILLLLGVLAAQAAKVADIKFDQQGVAKLTPEQIYYNIKLRPGSDFDRKTIDEDIKRLYNTGNFADVTATSEPTGKEDFNVVFHLRLQPQIRKVTFAGNAKFKDKEIKGLLKVASDNPLNNKDLRETLNAIREFYKSKGYNDAAVTPVVTTVSDGVVDVTFQVRENLRLRVDNVRFEGNTAYPESELKGVLANRWSILGSLPVLRNYVNDGLLDKHELELDKARLRELYYTKGYLDFVVDAIDIQPHADDPEWVDLLFRVSEGKPYEVGKITVSGTAAVNADDIRKLITLEAGKVYDGTRENNARKAISDYYESLGYADVNVRPVRHADFSTHKADVDFAVVEGRKYSVRDVIITGNTHTKDKVIRRELVLQPGDPVDRNRVEASKSRLMGMGYFESVETTAVNADDINEKDIHINVKEKDDRFNAKIGAGFSDVNSLVGMAEISSNNFDIANPGDWFYGGGQRFRIQGLFGIERMGFNVDFSEPWLFDQPLRLDVSFYGNQLDYDYWSERRIGFRTSLTRRIFDDFTSLTGAYKLENVNVFDMDRSLGDETRRQSGHSWVSQVSLMLDRDTRDSLVFPTSGYNINLLGAVSPKIFGSSDNFYRLEFKASGYYPLWDKAIILMGGFRIGTVANFDRNRPVPLYERYFLGGGDSLRGFPYHDVAPLDSAGKPAGGESIMVGTFEVTHPIWSFIRGAAFVDAGNAWRYSYNFQLSDLNVGVGYGLRIKLPMLNAPVKLDLAYPIVNNQDNISSKLRFHFNMGFTW